MARRLMFVDEAGNFDFSRKRGASRYFVLTSITMTDCGVGDALQALRREMAWRGIRLLDEFHATSDEQAVRDDVFAEIARWPFRIDATIIDKTRTVQRLRDDEERFYKTAWFYHMRHVAPRIIEKSDELLVVGAAIGVKKKRHVQEDAIRDVMHQTTSCKRITIASWPTSCEPCLQVADYCCWAIQRKWESNNARSHMLIAHKIESEYELFGQSSSVYY